ncbi:MAG: winged helix DNA-binding domain-containing protein [Candidatus Eisenbacteria bacterium]
MRNAVFTDRSLVHTWGQRDTLHVYPAADWPYFAASWRVWLRTGRRGLEPPAKTVEKTLILLERGEPLTRSDVFGLLPKAYVNEWEGRIGNRDDALKFSAGRLFWTLAHAGAVCVGPTRGREQTYLARTVWLPDLPWRELDPDAAATELTSRYLRVHGPATAHDVAHFFGAKVGSAQKWMERIPGLVEVECEGRPGLRLHGDDVEALRKQRPVPAARLLPKFDTLLMAHADKSWTVPDEAERKHVWLRFADVAAVVLAGGRVVATWKHKATRKRLDIVVTPLSGWKKSLTGQVEKDAERTATILGCTEAHVSLES